MAVKVIIKRTIPQGLSLELISLLLEQIRSLASIQPGYFYGETLQSVSNPEVHIVISTWKSIQSWHAWISSKERTAMQTKIDTILGTTTEYEVYVHLAPFSSQDALDCEEVEPPAAALGCNQQAYSPGDQAVV